MNPRVRPFSALADSASATSDRLVASGVRGRLEVALLEVVKSSLHRTVSLYDALIAALPESALMERLPGVRSNTIGQQLWCVIGARESYSRGIAAGEWKGFSCSVTKEQCSRKADLTNSLASSGITLIEAVSAEGEFTDAQHQLILSVLEHEAAHQGQLIRFLYALNLPIADSWKSRYALE